MAEDALTRAREIAARLSGNITGGSDLGKRKNRWEDDGATGGPGLGSIQRKKIYIPVREHPDINFLGLIIGPKGASQKQMSEATGAKILIRGKGAQKDGSSSNTGHPDDEDELHVYLEGSDDAVKKATVEIERLFNPEYANRIKQQQLGFVGNSSGGQDSVYGPGSGDGYQIELRVPNNMVGLIIGKGGENIVRIQTQLGVHAQIAKEHEMLPGETLRSIVLKGTPNNVNEAKSRIDEIIAAQVAKNSGVSLNRDGSSNAVRDLDHAFVVKLPVPNDKVGIIIGRGGMTIKGIQERTRSQVQIPLGPDEDNPQVRTLSVGGDTKEAVDSAQMEIFMCLQAHAQQAAQNNPTNGLMMMVPDDKVGIIIGKGGATIKDIQNRLRVKVQIPPGPDAGSMPPMRTISITGPAESQPIAKYEIEMILAGTPVNGGGGNHYGPSGGQYGQSYGASTQSYGSQYGAQAQWGQQGVYGAAAASSYYGQVPQQAAYGSYYGASAATAAANPYAAAYGSTAAPQAATTTAAPEVAAPTDATAYYNDFWQYSTYYGEAAARVFYGAWSPPQGTPPPPGIVVASPEVAAANLAAASGGAAAETTAAQADTSAGAAANGVQSEVTPSTTAATAESSAVTESAVASEEAVDPEAAAAAWETYKKQYAEWYEAHGKAAGADPNPPEL